MEGIPSQPKNLDPIDESALAELGHIIEGWQRMKDATVPLAERKQRFLHELETQYDALHSSDLAYPPDVNEMLDLNISTIEALEGTEEEIAAKCDDAIEYWRIARRHYIQAIS